MEKDKMNEDTNIMLCCLSEYDFKEERQKEGFKLVFGETIRCMKRDKKEDTFLVTLLIKDEAGVSSMKQIFSLQDLTEYDDVVSVEGRCYYLDYIAAHRQGLLLGFNCNWGYIRTLVLGKYDDEEIKSMLVEEYRDADYIEIRPMCFMNNIPVKESEGKARRMTVQLGEEEKRDMLEMAAKIVHYLTEMGKVVIADINTCSLVESMLDEYAYLGSSLAEEVVFKNPHLLEKQITDVDLLADNV